jgi:protein-S-isoprenylcysteine O-methyltransferase Ste14
MLKRLARLRVPLGFGSFAIAFWLASPWPVSLAAGAAVAFVGLGLRVWAAGHIEKGREITRSGPYRHMRHPLYVGSAVMAIGFGIAAASVATATVVVAYFLVTYVAAVRTEEATLDVRFQGEYSAYREGRTQEVSRLFSARRAFGTNREYRAVAGLVGAFVLLWWRAPR